MEATGMKVFGMIMKILAALAVVAGIIYVLATYGDKIVAWARKLLCRIEDGCGMKCACEATCCDTVDAESEIHAEEADFEG